MSFSRKPAESKPKPVKLPPTDMRLRYLGLKRMSFDEQIHPYPDGFKPKNEEWQERCAHCGDPRTPDHCNAKTCKRQCFRCKTSNHDGEMCPGIEDITDGWHERALWIFWAKFGPAEDVRVDPPEHSTSARRGYTPRETTRIWCRTR